MSTGAGPHRIEPWVQQRIDQLLVVAPTRYPDDSPFPASSGLHDLGRAMTQTANFLGADATVAIIGLSRIMTLFAHIATTQPNVNALATFIETRRWLQYRGLDDAAATVQRVGHCLIRYWRQSGHGPDSLALGALAKALT